MKISACLVTKGGTDLNGILDTITASGIHDIVVWDNGRRVVERHHRPGKLVADVASDVQDVMVYGRYAAISHAQGEFIYVQDDDCVVPPESIEQILQPFRYGALFDRSGVVANMPADFRHQFYEDHCLVGFGACFHRDLPRKAFDLFEEESRLTTYLAEEPEFKRGRQGSVIVQSNSPHRKWEPGRGWLTLESFWRTCDIVFTALTPRVLLDVPYSNQPWAFADDRLWRRADHITERKRMLETVLRVRDSESS